MGFYKIDPQEKVELFQHLAQLINKKMGKVDEESAARHFLVQFRLGQFGHYTLDPLDEILEPNVQSHIE